MLGYLGNKYDCNELSMLSKETDTIAISWKSIWGMLQKAYLVDNSNAIVKRVADKILQISQQETRLLADIVDYINNRTIICDFAYDAKVGRNRYKLTEKISRINLEKYLNHKAVGTLEDPQEARFEEGFILSDMWLENNSLQCDSVEYRLYTIGKTYDNIAALGQTIEINDTCTAIAFLSCAEFGHQNDSLIVNGADGKIELMFGVTDWTCSPPAFQESVAWKGHEGVIVGENCNKKHPLPRYIFSKIYKLPKRMHITNLLLPYCPNIHIFAITCIE